MGRSPAAKTIMSPSPASEENHPPVLIVGCGRVGCQLAQRWLADGCRVTGIARSDTRLRALAPQGLEVLRFDLDDPATSSRLPLKDALVYYAAPPPASGTQDIRMGNFLAGMLPGALPRAIVYLGTTGVYGQCHGAWVTEDHPTQPGNLRSRRRLHAEQLLTAWHRHSGVPVVLLRIAGIYGPGRLPLESLRKGQGVLGAPDAPYSNRIHEEDLVEVCRLAALRATGLHVYNVSDGRPGRMSDYYCQVARMAGLAPPRLLSWDEAEANLSEAMLEFLRESRRIDNRRMLDELGVVLKYPDLESGLAGCLS